MGDIFEMLNGGQFGGRKNKKGPKKCSPIKQILKATLEDIYFGRKIKVQVNRERVCTLCSGVGGK